VAQVVRANKQELLRAAEEKGITPNPHAIAIALGMSQQTIRRVLDGTTPTTRTILAISHGLGVTADRIFEVVELPD
jgi:transcriptional regulator with XRE-family HTH domain